MRSVLPLGVFGIAAEADEGGWNCNPEHSSEPLPYLGRRDRRLCLGNKIGNKSILTRIFWTGQLSGIVDGFDRPKRNFNLRTSTRNPLIFLGNRAGRYRPGNPSAIFAPRSPVKSIRWSLPDGSARIRISCDQDRANSWGNISTSHGDLADLACAQISSFLRQE